MQRDQGTARSRAATHTSPRRFQRLSVADLLPWGGIQVPSTSVQVVFGLVRVPTPECEKRQEIILKGLLGVYISFGGQLMPSFWELHDDLRHLLTNLREFADGAVPLGRASGSSCVFVDCWTDLWISAPSPYS
jgi:hypothetical protein